MRLTLFYFKYLFIYFIFLAALGLSCGTRDLSLRRVGSRACGLCSCGTWALKLCCILQHVGS